MLGAARRHGGHLQSAWTTARWNERFPCVSLFPRCRRNILEVAREYNFDSGSVESYIFMHQLKKDLRWTRPYLTRQNVRNDSSHLLSGIEQSRIS